MFWFKLKVKNQRFKKAYWLLLLPRRGLTEQTAALITQSQAPVQGAPWL